MTKFQKKMRKWTTSEYTVVESDVSVLYVKSTPNESTYI